MPYSVTDVDLLNTVSDRLLEPRLVPPAPTTTQWTTSDFTNAIDQAQKDFVKQTGIVVTQLGFTGDANTAIGVVPETKAVQMPQDIIDILRLAWIAYDTTNPVIISDIEELPRESAWSLDNGDSDWEYDNGIPPAGYTEDESPVQWVYLEHPPGDIGKLDLIYCAVSSALSNTGVVISVPDDFAPYLIWGALEILLKKDGEAQDLARAGYCHERFLEGVIMAKALLSLPFRMAAEGGS